MDVMQCSRIFLMICCCEYMSHVKFCEWIKKSNSSKAKDNYSRLLHKLHRTLGIIFKSNAKYCLLKGYQILQYQHLPKTRPANQRTSLTNNIPYKILARLKPQAIGIGTNTKTTTIGEYGITTSKKLLFRRSRRETSVVHGFSS